MFSHPAMSAPAIVVHGLDHARLALSHHRPLVLASAPGAAFYAGCLWWRALADIAAAEAPGLVIADLLDCADAPGAAMAALRVGCRALVLWPTCPAWPRVVAAAAPLGAIVLPHPPAALDLGGRDAAGRLGAWLRQDSPAADRDRADPLL